MGYSEGVKLMWSIGFKKIIVESNSRILMDKMIGISKINLKGETLVDHCRKLYRS